MLKLTDTQKAALKELRTPAQRRAPISRLLCAKKPDLSTFQKRIAFREPICKRSLDALKTVAPKEIAFYNSLDDKQKQEFEECSAARRRGQGKIAPGHGAIAAPRRSDDTRLTDRSARRIELKAGAVFSASVFLCASCADLA